MVAPRAGPHIFGCGLRIAFEFVGVSLRVFGGLERTYMDMAAVLEVSYNSIVHQVVNKLSAK